MNPFVKPDKLEDFEMGRYKLTFDQAIAWAQSRNRAAGKPTRYCSVSDDDLVRWFEEAHRRGVVEGCNNTVNLLKDLA